MKIAACQIPHIRNDVDRALSLVEFYTAGAQEKGVSLICFPECFLQGYDLRPEHVAATAIDLNSSEFEQILHRLEDLTPVIVLGLIEKEGEKFYNSAVVIEQGKLLVRYRKTHLFDNEQAVFEAGDDYPVFEVDGVTVGINICYDLQFAESVESAAGAGARLLACPCNNMMRPENAERWKERHNVLRCERAKETGVWILSSDVTGEFNGQISYGPTALIDSKGEVAAQVPLTTAGMLVAEFPVAETRTDKQ